MSDVARQAGVSPMTVSRAFRHDASISEKTRKTIIEAADALGYVLDTTASGFSSRKTGFVAVTIPSINNANFADTVRGLTERLRESELQILLGYTDYNVEEEERLVEQFLRRRPEAVVVTGGTHTERCRRLLDAAGVPVVETWDLPNNPIGHVVGFSNAAAAELVVEHFRQEGKTRLAFIGGDTSRDTRGLDRCRGFVEALESRGLDSCRLVASGSPPITMREGAAAARTLLSRWPDTEAVMCVSDLSAFGAMTECLRNGIRVPDNISIAGFGAYDIAEQSFPSITTVDAFAEDIGIRTAETVLTALKAPAGSSEPLTTKIAPKLIVRETG
ncbi:MAG: LacI family DNA-binding transcriptional regulator [Hyphomicrobiales bacterium]|nr:LacI family DNA-binding transcriptional regulator [Hyphomicrobiales bacterium]